MVRLSSKRFIAILPLLFLSALAAPVVNAAPPKAIAVLYPELQEPYRSVVAAIIEGIQEEIKGPLRLFSLGRGSEASLLKSAINPEHVAAIIALGRTGLAAAQQWEGEIPIVVGALLLTPDDEGRGISGITLAADPEMYFDYLERIAPRVKRVHVVYSHDSSAWLINFARSSANKREFKLLTYEVGDIKGAALTYREILDKSRSGEDAIWLLPDSATLDDRVIFPMLLRRAWDQNVLLFSGSPAHVKRGALFALYPDNQAMGKSLARMAAQGVPGAEGGTKGDVVPLRDVLAAINVRTAEHVGLFIPDEQLKKFSVILPTP